MPLKLKAHILFFTCGIITGCVDLDKAELAFQQENYAVAQKQWQQLADLGFPQAFIGLGKITEATSDKKDNLALKYYQHAYDLGFDPAAYQIGQFYYKHYRNQEELKFARQWTIKAAQQGSAGAYMIYADMQLFGLGEAENIESALSIFKSLSEHGYALASRKLAYLYEKGLNVKKDKQKAFNYFKLALHQGSIESELNIGRFYTNGYGVERNFSKAESIFKRFAESGNPQATYLLGKLYQLKFVLEGKPLLAESTKWFKSSAEKGYVPAKIRLIDLLLEEDPQNVELAVEKLKELSIQNEGKASYRLGRLFSTGRIADNHQEELKYYQLAYHQGYELAAYRIAEYFFVNQNNKQGQQKAQQWLQKALQQQSDNARFVQAELILHGHGLQQNTLKAIEIYQSLSDEGMSSASRTLAKIYEAGIYVDQDLPLAFSYFERAENQGDTYAGLDVARFYAYGLGVKSDWQCAKNIFLRYAKAGYSKAAFLLANGLEQRALMAGQKIPEQAVHWYQVAANQHNLAAQLRLIEMMLEGHGLKQDIKKATAELKLLSEQGVAEASFRLGEIYNKTQNGKMIQPLYYYQQAFLQGSKKPVTKLANLYRQGFGLKNNSIKTRYKQLADAGRTDAAYLLGILYETLSDQQQALYWFQKAALKNHSESQMHLVNTYRKSGQIKTANKWLLKAAQTGNGKAMLQYGEALFRGRYMQADKIQGLTYILTAARLHISGAVAKSLSLMNKLNSSEQIELANQRSKQTLESKFQ